LIDHQFEFVRLFDWKIGGLGAPENLVHVDSGTSKQIGAVRAAGQ
jgi:hypothetical protein